MVNKSNNLVENGVPSEGVLTNMSALERRRFLFKSVGKGAAAGVALGVPLSALADEPILVCKNPTTSKLIMCSVSGMQSAIGSRHLTTVNAEGLSSGYWGQVSDRVCVNVNAGTHLTPVWRPHMKWDCPAYTWETPVKTVLTYSTLDNNVTLAKLMAIGKNECTKPGDNLEWPDYSMREERHWIAAIFNAAHFPLTFPYTIEQIRVIANDLGHNDRANLYLLLKSLEF